MYILDWHTYTHIQYSYNVRWHLRKLPITKIKVYKFKYYNLNSKNKDIQNTDRQTEIQIWW